MAPITALHIPSTTPLVHSLQRNTQSPRPRVGPAAGSTGVLFIETMELIVDHLRRVPAERAQQKPSSPCGPPEGLDRVRLPTATEGGSAKRTQQKPCHPCSAPVGFVLDFENTKPHTAKHSSQWGRAPRTSSRPHWGKHPRI